MQRATSPRRDIREAKTLTTEIDHVPVATPIHPDAPKPRTQAKGPAYAQSVYERRMDRSRSPNATEDAGATPSRYNISNSTPYQHHSQQTPNRGGSTTPSTYGVAGGSYTPSHSILADRQQLSRASPIAVSPQFAGTVAVIPNNSSNSLTSAATADLSLTAPDRAMLEMLVAEAQDRHFVEKLFVAQEEKHERNQWLSIEAHRRRMLQMSYAAPLRIARMEAAQEQRVGHLIAEYEVGEEITEQRKRMDDRVAELRAVIDTTNRYRDALEELESDSKANYDRELAALEDDRRSKKRLLDELSRQYEFASIHNRTDDLYSPAFGLRAGLDYQRVNRRDPDPLKSPPATARVVETTADIRQSSPIASSVPQAIREFASPNASAYRNSTNYSTMTNFNASQPQNITRGSTSPLAHANAHQQLSSPAAPLSEPSVNGGASGADYSDVVAQSQRALARAEELERSATAGSRIARGRSNNTL